MTSSFLEKHLSILENFNFLKEEFIGFNIGIEGIFEFIFSQILALLLFFIFFNLGKYFRNLLKFDDKYINPFLNIALGFILIGTTIALLGSVGLINFLTISLLLFFSLIFSLYNSYIQNDYIKFLSHIKKVEFSKDIFTNFIIIFVLISFTRLLLPEIHEDGYHTDLAKLYYETHTIFHQARDPLAVIPYAQLPEMVYVIPIAFQLRESARTIHFVFYLLIILLLMGYSKVQRDAKFAPFLFALMPITTRYSSSQYSDFFMIYFFLLSILTLSLISNKRLFISGLMYGGVLSAKMWTIILFPVYLFYFFVKNKKLKVRIIAINLFVLGAFMVSSFWQIRSFLLTESPFSPFLTNLYYIGRPVEKAYDSSAIIDQALKFNFLFLVENANQIGPVLILGVLVLVLSFGKLKKQFNKNPIFLFFVLLTLLYFIVNFYGRYLFPWLILSTIFVSYGLVKLVDKYRFLKILLILLAFTQITYYSLTTLLTLPYGLGWADKNAYLTRVLERDNASYFNFNNQFEEFITKKDKVATYDLVNFYYADFNHIDINFVFEKDNHSFDLLKEKGITKLLLKDIDIISFCKKLSLTNCREDKTQLLTSYTNIHKFYLYKII